MLTGNPGTGKTTVARLLGEIYYDLGYLRSGHTVKVTRTELVAGFLGQTAIKTRTCIERAMGGVLFIDEAYSLVSQASEGTQDPFGKEAIETLLEAMSDLEGQFAVIAAGYPKEMKAFIQSNPGLPRRFAKTLHIDDYEPEELYKIFDLYAKKRNCKPDDSLRAMLPQFFENWFRARDEQWGNAGSVEKLVKAMYGSWCERGDSCKADSGKYVLTEKDIPPELKPHLQPVAVSKKGAMDRLQGLIGLAQVKKQIEALHAEMIVTKKAAEPGHYVFAGNPGTGKTTVARLWGDILCSVGVLRRGHVVQVGYEDLVSSIVGKTAPKTKAVVEKALDGILFIDEAYRLSSETNGSDVGQQAIDTLVPLMLNYKDRLCVICAGYTKPMEQFLQSNPGLESRFWGTIPFDDYNVDELMKILDCFAKKDAFTLEPEFLRQARLIFEDWILHKTDAFGNARDVHKFLRSCKSTLYPRLMKEYTADAIPEETKYILTAADIPEELRKHMKDVEETKKQAIERLQSMIGLSGVKDRIKRIKRDFLMGDQKKAPGHYVFAGNPGTGKTTVARLLGEILRDAGVLSKGHVVEVKREDLVAGYVGQTAGKTKKVCEQALDGVLFIDEAYSLSSHMRAGADYGPDAINALVAFMDSNRERLCVICAGYTADMERFVQTNPGLRSRFTQVIAFEDYSPEEMTEILRLFAGHTFQLADEYLDRSLVVFQSWTHHKQKEFGNARDVRKYFEECTSCLYERLEQEYITIEQIPSEAKHLLTGQDIPVQYNDLFGTYEPSEPKPFVPIPIASVSTQIPSPPFVYEQRRNALAYGLLLITVSYANGDQAFGSGFLITGDGYGVTCNHVIASATSIKARVRIPGRAGGDDSWHEVSVIKTNEQIDIALIKLDGMNFPVVTLDVVDGHIDSGDEIALFGYPFGSRLSDDVNSLQYSIFEGKISSLQTRNGLDQVFVDMQAKQGNSGGPVFNKSTGVVIGILCGSITTDGGQLVEEINYIRPIKYVWSEFIEKIT